MHGLASVPAALQTGDAIVARTTAHATTPFEGCKCIRPSTCIHIRTAYTSRKPMTNSNHVTNEEEGGVSSHDREGDVARWPHLPWQD